MNTILYTSAEVRQAIINLFSSATGRRVAVSAFVGAGAESYLPHPSGLELFCWPKVGGTNPNALRKLAKSGVQVFFVDALHTKLYWSENRGAVLTSANLSTNALGAGDLKEMGILLEAGAVDIEKVIRSLNPRPMSKKELSRLDRLHRLYAARNRLKEDRAPVMFKEWYESPFRPEVKFVWCDRKVKHSSVKAKEFARAEYNLKEPFKEIFVSQKNDFRAGDWVLAVWLGRKVAQLPAWYFVDYLISVPKSDKKSYDPKYPFEAVQLWPGSRYPSPPFQVTERFRTALARALTEFGIANIPKDRDIVPQELVELTYKFYT
jgi:predicted aspartyl protease